MSQHKRLKKLSTIRAALADGCSEPVACMRAGVSLAWWNRWRDADTLADAPRRGRPPSCVITAADAETLREHYLRSNRGRNAGSMAAAARWCAQNRLVSPGVAAAILKERVDTCALPAPVRRVFRDITAHEIAKYRDPKNGMGTSDGIRTPGWLRMNEDGKSRLEPGQRWVYDDGSVNVGIVVPWTRGGCPCSERYGVRVARYQLLAAVDCATDAIVGYGFIMNTNDSYKASDITATMYNICSAAGQAPREVVLEGGAWQANKTERFLQLAGIRMISAKGDPGQKLVESVFNRLWTGLTIALPAKGQIGRFRGEMKTETLEWLACRAGKKDPREHFPSLTTFIKALNAAIEYHNTKPITSRLYGRWVPAAAYTARRPESMLPVNPALRYETLPAEKVVTLKRNGCACVRWESPHGYPHDYTFTTEDLYLYGGAKVRVQFDPMHIRDGAVISLAEAHRGGKADTILSEAATCISPAPSIDTVRDPNGYLDARSQARAMKKASRARVVATVAPLDQRRKFKPVAPVFKEIERPVPAPLPLPARTAEFWSEAPDFDALEAAAGIF